MTTNLHHMGAMSNPYLPDNFTIHEDVVKSKLLDAMWKLTTCIECHYNRVVAKLQAFKEH